MGERDWTQPEITQSFKGRKVSKKVSKEETLTRLYAQVALAREKNDTLLIRKIELVIKRIENEKNK